MKRVIFGLICIVVVLLFGSYANATLLGTYTFTGTSTAASSVNYAGVSFNNFSTGAGNSAAASGGTSTP